VLNNLGRDIRYGFRSLIKTPGPTFLTIVILALGIGANTATFSVVNAVFLRPLPYEKPEQLVRLSEQSPQLTPTAISYPNFLDWREQNRVFSQMAAFKYLSFTITGEGIPEQLDGQVVSADFFSTLDIRPIAGRTFLPTEDKPGSPAVAIVSYRLWQGRYSGDSGLVGRSIILNERPHTIIGIAPRDFQFGGSYDVWIPFGQVLDKPGWLERDTRPGTFVIARLKDKTTLQEARDNMTSIANVLAQEYPATNTGQGVNVVPLHDVVVGNTKPVLLTLFGTVLFLLVIACANVANVLLLRATVRRKEIAIRMALGASRARIMSRLLTESILLAIIGGAFGVVIAVLGIYVVVNIGPDILPRVQQIRVDGRVLTVTLIVSILTGIVFGLIPSFHLFKSNPNLLLKEGGRGSTTNLGRRLQSTFVIIEVALSLMLLIGAGLLLKNFYRLRQINPGFDTSNVLTMGIDLPSSKYDDEESKAFFQRLLDQVRTQPSVSSASITTALPLAGGLWENKIVVDGQARSDQGITVDWLTVSPDYFKAMGIPLVSGMLFSERDDKNRALVLIIDETLAKQLFGSAEAALGKRVSLNKREQPSEVIAVVGNVKYNGVVGRSRPTVYETYTQFPSGSVYLAIRSTSDPLSIVGTVRNQVLALDKDVPVTEIRSMEQILENSNISQKVTMFLLNTFSLLALILASTGLYTVVSYAASQRTHEIAIRVSLGAGYRDVLKLIVKQGMGLVVIGVALGLILAFALTRLMAGLLFAVDTTDPMTFIILSVVLTFITFAACYIPAHRATKLDPMIVLRES
jgi:putative ABC transport system permease protein